MKNTIFWVIFFALVGVGEICLGVKLFKDEHIAAGMIMGTLGVVSLILSGVIGVIG